MKKLAVIGASYLQQPLIEKAKNMGLETHVFAWRCGDIGERSADFFYPISITEKEQILDKCIEIGIDGICTIASDLATVAVNYVANAMGLIGNSAECVSLSTNKHYMREAFKKNGDPSPKSFMVSCINDLDGIKLKFPVIVKPVDRSGSRGITKLESKTGLETAIKYAKSWGFQKYALVEEFAEGQEYSVEYISYRGRHTFLALTKKYTTGSPNFVERAHIEPAYVSKEQLENIKTVVLHALDSLKIRNGASHSELKVDKNGSIKLIEIGARMGGDFIGSDLVKIFSGIDFIEAVIHIALGEKPDLTPNGKKSAAAVRFVFSKEDIDVFEKIKREHPEYIVFSEFEMPERRAVTDSATRFGAYIIKGSNIDDLEKYMPDK